MSFHGIPPAAMPRSSPSRKVSARQDAERAKMFLGVFARDLPGVSRLRRSL